MPAPLPNCVQRRECPTDCIAIARTSARHLADGPRAAIRQTPFFFVLERRNTPFTSTKATTSPPRLAVAISNNTTFGASSGGVDCVLYSFTTHLARTLGFPGCPLSVSAHPILMCALPLSRRQAHSSGDSCVHLEATNVLHLFLSRFGAQLWIKPPAFYVIPMTTFPHAEQLLLIMMHESAHCALHVAQSVVFVVFMNHPSYPLHIFHLSFLITRLQLLLILFQLFPSLLDDQANRWLRLFHFFGWVVSVNPSMPMRAGAFALQPHTDLSRVSYRSHARVDKSWSSVITRSQPERAQVRCRCSRPRRSHDLCYALHSQTRLRR